MKKEISKLILMGIVLGLVISAVTLSYSNQWNKDRDDGNRIINMKEKLTLSEDQVAKIQDVQAISDKNLDKLMQKQEDDTETLSAKIKAGASDKELKSLLDVLQKNSIKIMDAKKNDMQKVLSVLTPMQQAKVIIFSTNEVKKEWNDPNRIDSMTRDLDLNDNQVAMLNKIFDASSKNINKLVQKKQADEDALNVKLESGLIDKELKSLLDVIRTDNNRIDDAQRNEMNQVRMVLNPTQQAKEIIARNDELKVMNGTDDEQSNEGDQVSAKDDPSYNTNYNPVNKQILNTNSNTNIRPILNTNSNTNIKPNLNTNSNPNNDPILNTNYNSNTNN